MAMGLIILIIVASIIVIHFFGFIVFLWCALAAVFVVIGAFFYMIFESEGRFKSFGKWLKKIWKKYLKSERNFFDWIDKI